MMKAQKEKDLWAKSRCEMIQDDGRNGRNGGGLDSHAPVAPSVRAKVQNSIKFAPIK